MGPPVTWAPGVPRHIAAMIDDGPYKTLAAIYSFADGEALIAYLSDPSLEPSFCFPSARTLAAVTGKGVSTIRAHTSALQAAGQIRRHHKFVAGEWREGWQLTPPPAPCPPLRASRDPDRPPAPRPAPTPPLPPAGPLPSGAPDPSPLAGRTPPLPPAGPPPSGAPETEHSTGQISDQISDQIRGAAAAPRVSPFADRPLRAVRPIGAVDDGGTSAREVLLEVSREYVAVDETGVPVVGRELRSGDRRVRERLERLLRVDPDGDAGEQVRYVLAIVRAFASLCRLARDPRADPDDLKAAKRAAGHWGPGMFETTPGPKNILSAWDMVCRDVRDQQERQASRAAAAAKVAAEEAARAAAGERPPLPAPVPRAPLAVTPELAAALARFAPGSLVNVSVSGR